MAGHPPPDGSAPAPWLSIPTRAISMVEHPCIVKNIDKGITSLGGPVKLSQNLRSKLVPSRNIEGEDELPKVVTASLRPDDPLAKRILGTPVTTNNLLLKVTVPKRTGRKRKRGSSGPFVADETEDPGLSKQNHHVPASSVFRRLQDNVGKYTVAVAGLIDETHRFRTLPDLQYAASTNKTMIDIRDNLLPINYGKLKNYNLDTTTGADKTRDVGASSEFIQMPIAYDYKYRQGARTDFPDDKGTSSIQRIQAYQNYSIIAPDAESVPQGPSPDLPPETDLTPYVQSLIAQIRLELQKRPIITRHLLYNTLGWDKRDRLRQATVYCGYFFRTGPWREALITWGVDPRTDPSFRRYQTVSYLSYKKTGTARHHSEYDRHTRDLAAQSFEDLENQHIFDGIHVSFTGNLFQFCDITDPLLRGILDTDRIRETCAPTMQGWYHIGTWAKATVILKHKMNRILTHPDETPDNTLYARILTWPELWDDAELKAQYRSEFFDKKVNKEKREEHALMKQVMWATRSPRYAFERMEKAEDLAQRMQGELTTTGRNLAEAEEEEAEEDDEVEVDMTEEPDTAKKILDEGDDEDDADDADEDEDEDEADEADVGDDIDAEGETDDGEYAQPGPRAGDGDAPSSAVPQGPRPFGGLYDSV